MKTLFTIFIITCVSFNISFAQKARDTEYSSVKLIYNKSTPSSKQELNYLLKDDKIALEKAQRSFLICVVKGKLYYPLENMLQLSKG
tara:strand:- start:359 stop:619 length:261 start_codon:yes stop_codon:yes gene_type:complete